MNNIKFQAKALVYRIAKNKRKEGGKGSEEFSPLKNTPKPSRFYVW